VVLESPVCENKKGLKFKFASRTSTKMKESHVNKIEELQTIGLKRN